MTTFLRVPPHLAPRALVCQEGLPPAVTPAITGSLDNWQRGDWDGAIHCVQQAQNFAQAKKLSVCDCIMHLWLADLYRETGQLGPALDHCQNSLKIIGLITNYDHKNHTRAIITYLLGLLHHALGTNQEALDNYQQAFNSFEQAINDWDAYRNNNPTYSEHEAEKCRQARMWINALMASYWARAHSSVECEMDLQLPVTNGLEYRIACLEADAYLAPTTLTFDNQRYQMHRLDDGVALETNGHLKIQRGAYHFLVKVPERGWAGPHSETGDYILVRLEPRASDLAGTGVLRDGDSGPWNCGTFTYNPETERFWFHPFHLVGGPPYRPVKDQETGVVHVLLKPV